MGCNPDERRIHGSLDCDGGLYFAVFSASTIHSGPAFFFEARSFSSSFSQVVKLCAADVGVAVNLHPIDHGRSGEERALDANAVRGRSSDGEASVVAAFLYANDGAAEFLDPLSIPLSNPDMNADHISGTEIGDVGIYRRFDCFQWIWHGRCPFVYMTRRPHLPGGAANSIPHRQVFRPVRVFIHGQPTPRPPSRPFPATPTALRHGCPSGSGERVDPALGSEIVRGLEDGLAVLQGVTTHAPNSVSILERAINVLAS